MFTIRNASSTSQNAFNLCVNNTGFQVSVTNPAANGMYNWYNNANFQNALLTNSNTFSTTMQAQSTTLYVRDENPAHQAIISLDASAPVSVDHNSLSGDDRGGIAITGTHVYYVGDNNTVRYDLALTPASGTSLPIRDGIFSDLATGTLYTFHNGTDELTSGTAAGFVISELRTMDADLVISGTAAVTLSQPITVVNDYSNVVYAGKGVVGLFNYGDSSFYVIDLATGNVTDLGQTMQPDFMYGAENWAEHAILDFDGLNYYAVQRGISWNGYANENDIVRFALPNTATVDGVVQSFTTLGDTYDMTYDINAERLYIHVEGSGSDFVPTTGNENLAYISGTRGNILCPAAVQVTVATCVGVDEIAETSAFTLFPNPARTMVTIAAEGGSINGNEVNIQLFDLQGKLLRSEMAQNIVGGAFQHSIALEGLAKGVYFVRMSDERNSQTLRLVVE